MTSKKLPFPVWKWQFSVSKLENIPEPVYMGFTLHSHSIVAGGFPEMS